VNPTDEQSLTQRLHEEIGSLTVPPVPGSAVRQRGRTIRTRRRAFAAGTAALAIAIAAVSVQALAGAGGGNHPAPLNPQRGVFAAGVTRGMAWQMAVRNIAADPGTHWCLPAVMVNGHDGTVLSRSRSSPATGLMDFGDAGYIPGLPGVAFGFLQVPAGVTRVVYDLPGARPVQARPVAVTACGHRFLLIGFGYTRGGLASITTHFGHRHWSGRFPMSGSVRPRGRSILNLDADIWNIFPKPVAAARIASGTTDHVGWAIAETLTTTAQGYTGSTVGAGAQQATRLGTIEAPPSDGRLARVVFPSAVGRRIAGYAGLVSPRTRTAIASLSNGATRTMRPVTVDGRVYIALAVPHGVTVTRLLLLDKGGPSLAPIPPAGG
jgi:hypothetical protein